MALGDNWVAVRVSPEQVERNYKNVLYSQLDRCLKEKDNPYTVEEVASLKEDFESLQIPSEDEVADFMLMHLAKGGRINKVYTTVHFDDDFLKTTKSVTTISNLIAPRTILVMLGHRVNLHDASAALNYFQFYDMNFRGRITSKPISYGLANKMIDKGWKPAEGHFSEDPKDFESLYKNFFSKIESNRDFSPS